MTDFSSSTYNQPGVYVEDDSTPYADPLSTVLSDRYLCLVGPAVGYQAATETIRLYSATPTALSHTGVSQSSTLTVTTLNGAPLTLNQDFSVTVDSSTPNAPVTSLSRLPSDVATASPNAGVNDGDYVQVTYNYTEPTYFQPQRFIDYSSLTSVYGAPLTTDSSGASQISSPLSLGARVAFENGASRVMCIAVTGTDDASWAAAYEKAYAMIATDQSVNLVVPIFPEGVGDDVTSLSGLLIDLRAHVRAAYASGYGRMALAGAPAGYNETSAPIGPVASAVSDKRVVLAYPTKAQMYNSSTAQTITVGGTYLAAAMAGFLANNPVQQGLTQQTLNTLTSLSLDVQQKMTKSFMDGLAEDGVAVVMSSRNGRLKVRHGLSTDMTSMVTREISVTRAGDTLMVDLQEALDSAGLIGSPITADTTSNVKSLLVGILEQEVSNQVIRAYANVAVSQRVAPGGDPSIIDCSFSYQPALPLNYIQVSFSLNLNLGDVTTSTDTDDALGTTTGSTN